ncbi:unnamed protein product [Moneuplotes crassus]|uniref:Uncharacterized protein n=1 Tax=Euplotes crassus TaxID=5936 RepID=A0AAD1U4Y9_EUPCR|nr:unnamed protein product [Moneuplotes crassus]
MFLHKKKKKPKIKLSRNNILMEKIFMKTDKERNVFEKTHDVYTRKELGKSSSMHELESRLYCLNCPVEVKEIRRDVKGMRRNIFGVLNSDNVFNPEGYASYNFYVNHIDKLKMADKKDYEIMHAEMKEKEYQKMLKQSLSKKKMNRLYESQVKYLKSVVESGGKIQKDKTDLFRLLVLKDDPLKIGENMLKESPFYPKIKDKVSFSPRQRKKSKKYDEMEERRMRYESKMEGKLISQAAKKFNIHLHSQNLLKENGLYLNKLNDQINKKLAYYLSDRKSTKRVKRFAQSNTFSKEDSFAETSSDGSHVAGSNMNNFSIKMRRTKNPVKKNSHMESIMKQKGTRRSSMPKTIQFLTPAKKEEQKPSHCKSQEKIQNKETLAPPSSGAKARRENFVKRSSQAVIGHVDYLVSGKVSKKELKRNLINFKEFLNSALQRNEYYTTHSASDKRTLYRKAGSMNGSKYSMSDYSAASFRLESPKSRSRMLKSPKTHHSDRFTTICSIPKELKLDESSKGMQMFKSNQKSIRDMIKKSK